MRRWAHKYTCLNKCCEWLHAALKRHCQKVPRRCKFRVYNRYKENITRGNFQSNLWQMCLWVTTAGASVLILNTAHRVCIPLSGHINRIYNCGRVNLPCIQRMWWDRHVGNRTYMGQLQRMLGGFFWRTRDRENVFFFALLKMYLRELNVLYFECLPF